MSYVYFEDEPGRKPTKKFSSLMSRMIVDSTNNILALAFGVLIVFLIITGSI